MLEAERQGSSGSHNFDTSGLSKPQREPCQPRGPGKGGEGDIWNGLAGWVHLSKSGSGEGRRWHRPSRGERPRWEWLPVKQKSRQTQHLRRTASSRVGKAEDKGTESHTIPPVPNTA